MKIDLSNFTSPMVVHGVELMREIVHSGYEAYIVGGTVRDIAMGDNNVHDIDIATNMPIDEIKKKYRTIEYGGGERHGTVIVRFKDQDYELTQFRTDGTYTDGRRPDSVEFVKDFKEDTKRRDFTINSMGIDSDGNVIDYHGGLDDIKTKTLRTVGNADDRFGEDSLRILRAIRFAARFGFNVSEDVIDAIKRLKKTITSTSTERIRDELVKTMEYGGDKFAAALLLMYNTGVMEVICPVIELTPTKIMFVKSTNSKDQIVNFSILLNDHPIGRVDHVKDLLKLDNRVVDGIKYVLKNLDRYGSIATIDHAFGYDIVSNRDFYRLRSVYVAINGKDIDNADKVITDILSLEPVVRMGGRVSEIMSETIKPSKEFGQIKNYVLNMLFIDFIYDKIEPTEESIRKYVTLAKEFKGIV